VEAEYGDLDALFDEDELQGLIDELTYTTDDARHGRPNPSRIRTEGDIRNNLASYKSAVMKYQRFRQDVESEAARPAARRIEERRGGAADSPTLSLEADLQRALRANIEQVEPGLRLADGGAEKKVDSGFIDILAAEASGRPVVIELKAVTARREVLGQIAAYMADVAEETGQPPRGILIAPEFDPRLVSGARMVEGLKLMRYSFSFTFDAV
jgi:hypothetical protein